MDAVAELEKRRKVLTCAEAVFATRGYASTKMADLAGSAGMSRPALYLMFPKKYVLFSSIVCSGEKRGARLVDPAQAVQEMEAWILRVCALWLGEQPCEGDDRDHWRIGRVDALHRDLPLLEKLIASEIGMMLPSLANATVCADCARLVTFCIWGLLASPLGAAERRQLLSVQVRALAAALLSAKDAPKN